MDCLPKDDYFKFNDNTLQEVRKTFNLDKPGAMEDVIHILEEWVKEQPHFTKKDFDRKYLEATIISSKGSIERAKSRLDKGCTIRTLMPHLFELHDIRHLYETELKPVKHYLLPKMTKNNERVYIVRVTGNKFEDTVMSNFNRTLAYMGEYTRRNDYAKSYYGVLDYMDVNLLELGRHLTINALQEMAAYLLECCGFRLKGIYFISSSTLVGIIVGLYKQVLSAKLRERVHVIKDREALKNFIDEEILPVEYGGKEKCFEEFHDNFLDAVTSAEHIKYLKEINSARTDESKRQTSKFNDEYMGMPGSFRKLNVD